ncbi:hypothetical protein AAFF_G00265310 [Aldrovandia affinis]|uniref:Ig-like domain-containing protein n=1 Tax=Aldrovandia affinis TaxID=143900 RepID=A0AAD7RBF4_9TELE|nr:hypothetical protein AAFF_G00265310 [Aldrovandia affinis]
MMLQKAYQYQLNVYINVSVPQVNITQDTHPCTIQCIVWRETAVTLSWYREGEKKSYVSSFIPSAPHLDLPETVEKGGVYTCEAKNSVSRETAKLTVGDQCTGQRVNLEEVTCGLCREEVMMYTTTSLQHSGEHGRTAALSSQTGDVDVFLLLTRNLE